MLNEQRGEGRTLHIHTPEKSSEPSLKSGRRIVRKPEFNKYVPQHKKKLDSSLGHNTSLNRGSFKLEPARKYIKRLATEVESLTPLSSTEEGF